MNKTTMINFLKIVPDCASRNMRKKLTTKVCAIDYMTSVYCFHCCSYLFAGEARRMTCMLSMVVVSLLLCNAVILRNCDMCCLGVCKLWYFFCNPVERFIEMIMIKNNSF